MVCSRELCCAASNVWVYTQALVGGISLDCAKRPTPGSLTPPKAAIDAFARCIYPAILEYFESEQGQKEFAEWKQKQKRNAQKYNQQ